MCIRDRPQIVKATAKPDGGGAFISKMFTLGVVVLLVCTAIAMIAAPGLVALATSDKQQELRALATALAYWCLPQILFYGIYALLGETLNARRIFGPFSGRPSSTTSCRSPASWRSVPCSATCLREPPPGRPR